MNDEQMQSLLDAWFEDTDSTPPDTRRTAVEVMARVPDVRQRGRRWPLPLLRRKAPTPVATDTTDYRPSPIPATNGHAPTVIGRTHAMFSPVKAITAGTLVFAIGGVLFIAQPLDQGASVPGAETDAEAMRPAFVNGTMEAHSHETEDITYPDGLHRRIAFTGVTGRAETSDSRLTGDFTADLTLDIVPDPIVPDVEGVSDARAANLARFGAELQWGNVRIENDAGAWEGQSACVPTVATNGFDDPCFIGLTGSGAYEGLSAVLLEGDELDIGDGETFMLEGFIFAGNLPPDR